MTLRSVLFTSAEERAAAETAESPVFFRDLNLDQIVNVITAAKEEYNLKPYFYSSLKSIDAIMYRQEVMRDLEKKTHFEMVKSFVEKMREMREHLAQAKKLHYRRQKQSWFLDAVELYCAAVQSLSGELDQVDLESRGLSTFRDYVKSYVRSDAFTSLVAETTSLKQDLAAVHYCLLIKYGSISVRRYDAEADYRAEVEATFEKFKQGAIKGYSVEFRSSEEMNHVEAQVLDGVATLYPDVFLHLGMYCDARAGYLDETIAIFDREIQFYVSYLEFLAEMKQQTLDFCYPEVTGDSKEVYDLDCFDLALAHKLRVGGQQVVCNDFHLAGSERIIVVSGPNQGGKTTFARAFGQLHYLASLGCPVPGKKAQLFLFDRLFTHFEKAETVQNGRGKLQDDLLRFHEILNAATSRSVVVMNEIFSSTTLQDAMFLGKRIMETIMDLDILCVCVTFIDELSCLGEKTVSMVSSIVPEDPALRTYKIVRKPADGLAYALSIAEKYRLTAERLRERLRAMKAHLLYRDRDFAPERTVAPNAGDLMQDLHLSALFDAMAQGDKFILDVSRKVVLSSLRDPQAIRYRQDIVKDCLSNSAVVNEIYALALESLDKEKELHWGLFDRYPSSILNGAIAVLEAFVEILKRLRSLAEAHSKEFQSEGFAQFFRMLKEELSDSYIAVVNHHLKQLRFRGGVLVSAELGRGGQGTGYVLRKPRDVKKGFIQRMFSKKPPEYSFSIPDRDESGAKALSELRDRGVNLAANALAQSKDHIFSFFQMLRTELAFYLGCMNLHARLVDMGANVCFPVPAGLEVRKHAFTGLYDVCLALSEGRSVVANDLRADNRNLVVVTGANQGGKSTFLRGIGVAQLMMQSGMFVGASEFASNVCDGIFSHYKREEDVEMKSGQLDEELKRMSAIVDGVTANSLLLLNESFASTNEREGSEIARQVIGTLLEAGIKIFFVTHLHKYAQDSYERHMQQAVFLRAGRKADGARTFKILVGEPLQTSFGEDLYRSIFGFGNPS